MHQHYAPPRNAYPSQQQFPQQPGYSSPTSRSKARNRRGDELDPACRPRLTPEQTEWLERSFDRDPKPTTAEKKEQAAELGLPLEKVCVSFNPSLAPQCSDSLTCEQNWFQNRRAKSKQVAKALSRLEYIDVDPFPGLATPSSGPGSTPTVSSLDASHGFPPFTPQLDEEHWIRVRQTLEMQRKMNSAEYNAGRFDDSMDFGSEFLSNNSFDAGSLTLGAADFGPFSNYMISNSDCLSVDFAHPRLEFPIEPSYATMQLGFDRNGNMPESLCSSSVQTLTPSPTNSVRRSLPAGPASSFGNPLAEQDGPGLVATPESDASYMDSPIVSREMISDALQGQGMNLENMPFRPQMQGPTPRPASAVSLIASRRQRPQLAKIHSSPSNLTAVHGGRIQKSRSSSGLPTPQRCSSTILELEGHAVEMSSSSQPTQLMMTSPMPAQSEGFQFQPAVASFMAPNSNPPMQQGMRPVHGHSVSQTLPPQYLQYDSPPPGMFPAPQHLQQHFASNHSAMFDVPQSAPAHIVTFPGVGAELNIPHTNVQRAFFEPGPPAGFQAPVYRGPYQAPPPPATTAAPHWAQLATGETVFDLRDHHSGAGALDSQALQMQEEAMKGLPKNWKDNLPKRSNFQQIKFEEVNVGAKRD
jgi:hypothetical protein